MPKQILTRKASDNLYFHKDFHIAFNYAIDYLYENYGEEEVREYLKQFADTYYSILKKSLIDNGLSALKEHYEKIYKLEGAEYRIDLSEDELKIHLLFSPAVKHIKASGRTVSPVLVETVKTVNEEICKETPYEFEMIKYHPENGSYQIRFYKRTK